MRRNSGLKVQLRLAVIQEEILCCRAFCRRVMLHIAYLNQNQIDKKGRKPIDVSSAIRVLRIMLA